MEAWNQPPLSTVLGSINRLCAASATCSDGRGEWFVVKSDQFPDQVLFNRLQAGWSQIVPAVQRGSFALILCRGGPNSGVWLHYLSTPLLRSEYLAGCYDIISWT